MRLDFKSNKERKLTLVASLTKNLCCAATLTCLRSGALLARNKIYILSFVQGRDIT